MKRAEDRQDFGLVVVLLRTVLGWNRPMLSQRSGIDEDLIGDYERGLRSPIQKNRVRLAQAFAVEPSFLEDLVPICRSIRLAYESAAREGGAAAPSGAEIGRVLERTVPRAVLESMEPFLLELRELGVRSVPRHEDRSWARELWAVLEPLPVESRGKIVQLLRGDERLWALAVEIGEASCTAAPHNAAEALRLAQFAAAISREASGPQAWQSRPRGFCELFVANALRVAGKLAAAREAFAHADELWAQGEAGDPAGLLDGTRRLDLKASFLRQDGDFAQALDLLDQALIGSPPQAAAHFLIQRATTQSRAGDYEMALEALKQVEHRIAMDREPRLFYGYHFSIALNYSHLGRYREAERLLPQIEALAADLRNDLDGIRTLWLAGRVHAGLGRREEAVAALAEVRRCFLAREIAYDYALVSLELATLHLEQGRTGLVKELAGEMVWIFEGEKVHREALAALALFRRAAQIEEARADWTRRLVKYLYRAQHDPGLRFEA
jgi:tetratricopeptide (TPR) repeat protein